MILWRPLVRDKAGALGMRSCFKFDEELSEHQPAGASV
jgi:hypothetical protein